MEAIEVRDGGQQHQRLGGSWGEHSASSTLSRLTSGTVQDSVTGARVSLSMLELTAAN